MHRMMLFVESLVVVRKMQLASDLVELSLKRLKSRRVPKTKKYKHNLIEERQTLLNSSKAVFDIVQKLLLPLRSDVSDLLQSLLFRVTNKESIEEEGVKSHLLGYIW